ncbi:MAG: PAS domain S-box protein [Acidiferrobacteraceae bacterium]
MSQTQIEARLHLAAIVESSDDAIISKTLDGVILSWNGGAERVFGYGADETIGQPISILIPKERLGEEVEILRKIRQGQRVEHYETVRRRKDGRSIEVSLTISPIRTDQGVIVAASKVARDISARKLSERALRSIEARLGLVINNTPIILCAFDERRRVTLLEGRGLALIGFSGSPDTIAERWETTRPEWLRHAMARCFDSLSPTVDTGRIGTCWFEAHFVPLLDEDGRIECVTGVLLDITSQRHLQEELFRASKLESIGVLAAGIAHDFNNVLTAIAGNLALTRLRVQDDTEVGSAVLAAEQAALRARGLTQQLLTFTKGGKPVTRRMCADRAVREAVDFAMRRSGVATELCIAPDLWPIAGDEGQIAQMLHNLLINAEQAMPSGGRITVRAQNTCVGSAESVLAPGDYVRIDIEDTGSGIRPEHVAKIFDPFFTTKTTGSGLGLTSSYWIVKNHGGLMTVASTWGVGSTFTMLLPRSTEPSELPAPAAPLLRGRGHILFMDDEPAILDFAERVLPVLGYRVVLVARGEEAIERFEQALAIGDPFDIVMLDLVIRDGLGGLETLNELHQRDPDVVAVVSSGYANDPIMAEFRSHGFFARVAKPYSVETLSTVLSDAMRSAGAGAVDDETEPAWK